MIIQNSFGWLISVVAVVLLGAVVLGTMLTDTSRFSPLATTIARATAAQDDALATTASTENQPPAGVSLRPEWIVILALIGVIIGLMVGILLSLQAIPRS